MVMLKDDSLLPPSTLLRLATGDERESEVGRRRGESDGDDLFRDLLFMLREK